MTWSGYGVAFLNRINKKWMVCFLNEFRLLQILVGFVKLFQQCGHQDVTENWEKVFLKKVG